MRVFDSIKQLLLCAPLAGCVTAGLNGPDISALDLANLSHQAPDNMTRIFQENCLANATPDKHSERFVPDPKNWQFAEDDVLSENGLGALRKTVLEMPGGGARYSETQNLYAMTVEDRTFILGVEEAFARKERISSSCRIYAEGDLLRECESVGQLAAKAPDKNLNYPSSQARFISWDVKFGDNAAVVSCEQAPQSKLLPYAGVILSLTIDETIKANPPASVAAGR